MKETIITKPQLLRRLSRYKNITPAQRIRVLRLIGAEQVENYSQLTEILGA
tara:strand:+ start:1882 stop:2034 length:153 start_codon:yes stop_codon:yes gene_type:complete